MKPVTKYNLVLIALAGIVGLQGYSALRAYRDYHVHAQTRIAPEQLKAPHVAVMTCTKPAIAPVTVTNPDGTTTTTPGSNCAGLYYVDVVTPAGTELKILGTVQPGPVNAADWSLVP